MNNPLASRNAPREAPDPALLQHAQIWQHMHSQPTDDLHQKIATIDYGLPIMGRLAGNPKTTAKDVIRAVSQTVADQKLSPSAGVALISQMPADPDKLRPWLQQQYAINLAAAVHAKAALLARAQPQAAPQPAAPAAAPAPAVAAPGG